MTPSGEDDVEQDVADATAEAEGNLMYSVVKMKLASFCSEPALRAMIDAAALTTNNIVGEAYAFANFHVTRTALAGEAQAPVTQKFYYACLACVSKMNVRESTVSDAMKLSAAAFDALRPEGSNRLDATNLMDLMPDVAVTMATMGTNHLWMNLCKRISCYLKWKHPEVKKALRTVIVRFVAKFPRMSLDDIEQLKLVRPAPVKGNIKVTQPLSDDVIRKRLKARQLIEELRSICPLPNGKHVASRAHTLLPLYLFIHRQFEAELLRTRDLPSNGKKDKKGLSPKARFTLLPMKGGYTVSYIPISDRFMTTLVTRLKTPDGRYRVKLTGSRGKDAERASLWRRFFNVNAVETSTRKFNGRIASDGVAVSVIMSAQEALVQSNTSDEWDPSVLPKNGRRINTNGTDPGITDVATATIMNDKGEMRTESYSSSRYYEKSKVKLSARRTKKWNLEVEPSIDSSMDASTDSGLSNQTMSYLASVRQLHGHRASRGYRNMRFLRYTFKKKAVKEICDMLAPPNEFTIVGFGDWGGPNGTLIKRRYSGPLQEIKKELKRRTDSVLFRPIWEYKTSVLDSQTWTRMKNMVATSWSRDKEKKMVQRKKSKIHKVMHCQTSQQDVLRPSITTWNRDVNASRNILMLLMTEIRGFERPSQFKKTPQMPSRRARAKAPTVQVTEGATEALSFGSS